MSAASVASSFLQDFGDLFDNAEGVYEEDMSEDAGPQRPDEEEQSGQSPGQESRRSRRGARGNRPRPQSDLVARNNVPVWARPPEGRWRGGACPRPLEFDGDIEKDPACLRHWKRDIKIWEKRSKHYLPPHERALELLGALRGRAKRDLATVDPDVFDHPDGVTRLIEKFEVSCAEERVVRQSAAIHKYEELVRSKGQSMLSYVADWHNA